MGQLRRRAPHAAPVSAAPRLCNKTPVGVPPAACEALSGERAAPTLYTTGHGLRRLFVRFLCAAQAQDLCHGPARPRTPPARPSHRPRINGGKGNGTSVGDGRVWAAPERRRTDVPLETCERDQRGQWADWVRAWGPPGEDPREVLEGGGGRVGGSAGPSLLLWSPYGPRRRRAKNI